MKCYPHNSTVNVTISEWDGVNNMTSLLNTSGITYCYKCAFVYGEGIDVHQACLDPRIHPEMLIECENSYCYVSSRFSVSIADISLGTANSSRNICHDF